MVCLASMNWLRMLHDSAPVQGAKLYQLLAWHYTLLCLQSMVFAKLQQLQPQPPACRCKGT